VANTMIDLGEARPLAVSADAGPPVPWRAILSALSVVLIVLLAGSAASAPFPAPLVIPAGLADATFIDGDRLFLVGFSREVKTINAYSLPDGHLLSRTTVPVTGSVSNVLEAGDTLVVSYQVDQDGSQGTLAATIGTDHVLWRRLDGLAGASGPAGVALLSTGYGARNEAVWQAVDLHTGVVRWSTTQPADGYTMVTGPIDEYPQWFVTLHADGRIETRDAVTGQVTAARQGPPIDPNADSIIWAVGDLAIIGGEKGGVTAYRLPGLAPIWTTRVDLGQTWMQTDCGRVLCAFRPQQGMLALDPADGHLLWQSGRWAYAEPAGPYLVAAMLDRARDDAAYWVLDPLTGRVLGNFGNWDVIPSDTVPQTLYGIHLVPGASTIYYGTLDPVRRTASILGRGEAVQGSCQTSSDALICRLNDASVAIWKLR
jgi:outer membrane protein assembly factor BamB